MALRCPFRRRNMGDAGPDAELIERSLELVAACGEDITQSVFDRFFAAAPAAHGYFHLDDIDPRARGRMLAEVLTLIVDGARGETYVGPTFRTQVADHQSYGVIDQGLYAAFLTALITVIHDLSGDGWSTDMQTAWARQADRLMRAGFRETTQP